MGRFRVQSLTQSVFFWARFFDQGPNTGTCPSAPGCAMDRPYALAFRTLPSRALPEQRGETLDSFVASLVAVTTRLYFTTLYNSNIFAIS
jgi:hypothetical protein